MVHAQNGHVRTAARAALGDLAEGMVINAQETDRAGCLAGRGFHQGSAGTQAGERKPIAAAGLLDEGGIAQGLEDTIRAAAHVVRNGQYKTGSQLAEGRAGPGESGRVRHEAPGNQQFVKFNSAILDIPVPGFLHLGDVISHAPEHLFNGFGQFAVIAFADIAAGEHLIGVFTQFGLRQAFGHGRGGKGFPGRLGAGHDLLSFGFQ
jgi:hypothetical protein